MHPPSAHLEVKPVVVKGSVKDVPVQDWQKSDPIDYTHSPNLGY